MQAKSRTLRLAIASTLSLVAAQALAAPADNLDEIVVTGTRVPDRTATETAVPVDVVTAESLAAGGVTELNQALSVNLPSFNFPRPGLSDGTDTIRPATLRGLAPDQTLVLVNSKRRHAAALVNVNATIGRGSSAVDLNTIPTAAINSLEVLRDGASAQYGSDAIAGVINLRLREASEGGNIGVTYGTRDTKYEVPVNPVPANANYTAPSKISRSRNDGQTTTVSAWKGLPLGDAGFLTLTFEYKDAERTERAGYDVRRQYPLVAGAFDPREQTFDRFTAWYGDPELEQLTGFVNAGYDLSEDVKLYGWASYQKREAVSAGFFRQPDDARNVIQIYPDGFLPQIAPDVTDYSAAVGTTWALGGWDMDASVVYGYNEMMFTIQNTLNRSLGTLSPTSFDAGGFDYEQAVFNLSGVRSVDVAMFDSPLSIALGVEARQEKYTITAGEPDSYRNGGVLIPIGATGCTSPNPAQVTAGGCAAASGAQVFPGFRPSNEVDEDRTAVGAYIDLEANVTEKLLASIAGRFEDYSDFGSSASGKLSLRYDFTDAFALRGSVQNGFRAPSLQQQFFTTTSTNFINGVPFDITTFPVSDPVAAALGAQPLEAEESVNFSIGAVMKIGVATLTIDAYRIDIDDRIVLSENLNQTAVQNYLAAQGFIGIGGARFFINGVETRTEGFDVVFNYPVDSEALGRFDFTVTGNWNSTDVLKTPITPELQALGLSTTALFSRINVLTFEEGTPKDKFAANVNWNRGIFGATLRGTLYGEVLDPGTPATGAQDVRLSSKTVVDLEFRVSPIEKLTLAVGADNVFDQYPDPLPLFRNTTNATTYSQYAPFGRSGRFVYGKVSYNF